MSESVRYRHDTLARPRRRHHGHTYIDTQHTAHTRGNALLHGHQVVQRREDYAPGTECVGLEFYHEACAEVLQSFVHWGRWADVWLTENEPLVANRAGWNEPKVMNIYLQELVSTTFLSNLQESTRRRVKLFADQCPYVWHQSFRWLSRPAVDNRVVPP